MEEQQNEEVQEKKSPIQHALKWGLIVGVIGAILTLLLYVMGPEYMVKWWVGLISLALFIGLVIYGGITYRNEIGGYMDFGPAFMHGFITLAIAGIVGTIFNLVLYTVVDPNLPEALTEATVEQAMSMAEGFGAPAEALEEAAENARTQAEGQFSATGLVKQYFIGLIIYAVLALITGLIVRRKEKVSDVY
jgi:hypothetical protein